MLALGELGESSDSYNEATAGFVRGSSSSMSMATIVTIVGVVASVMATIVLIGYWSIRALRGPKQRRALPARYLRSPKRE
jgi:hypothetical protein